MKVFQFMSHAIRLALIVSIVIQLFIALIPELVLLNNNNIFKFEDHRCSLLFQTNLTIQFITSLL
jgi:hypothetical protein